jgi:hypothetical protein
MIDQLDAKTTTVFDAKVLDLARIDLDSGALTAINSNEEVPFSIKRVYYLYDVPNKSDRGAHAHKELMQLVVAASGSFEIELNDGVNSKTFMLRQPDEGLLVPPGLWRDLRNFSGGGICMVLASDVYNESDYIRDINKFLIYKGHEEV